MPPPQIDDPRFEALLKPEATLERLWTGAVWSEGPVYLPQEQAVVWSDIPNDRMLRWSADRGGEVWRAPSEYVNGNVLDLEGRIVHCSHGARALQRTEPDGSVTTLVDAWEGKRLNSPNDVVVRSDGTIWFTDPPYGILSDVEGHKADSEIGTCLVFRFDPGTGALDPVIEDVEHPNGIAFSPDEARLYVSDTGGDEGVIRVWDVVEGGARLTGGDVFAHVAPGISDGFRVDVEGNVWTSSLDSVQVFDPDGVRLGKVFVPEKVGNVCFGGPEGMRLFVAGSSSLYAIDVGIRGATAR
jgi:gluconolactonase